VFATRFSVSTVLLVASEATITSIPTTSPYDSLPVTLLTLVYTLVDQIATRHDIFIVLQRTNISSSGTLRVCLVTFAFITG
jgi:hypothetical protein